jgi:hypothetical protein
MKAPKMKTLKNKKVSAISKEELDLLRNTLAVIQDAKKGIAEAELAKIEHIGRYHQADAALRSQQAKLKEDYGDVVINIDTGEIKEANDGADKKD